ncbi:putative Transmembrane protein [Heracleum sosnowskyi]|uniref:Transmembrane protein n=1 Tax=Heracleum sosnowskyi TaxID=360622 RepID=A0AAD8N2U9_9APIA|nr:putative Transmembrane protein [Heracleum sosnowskyi]
MRFWHTLFFCYLTTAVHLQSMNAAAATSPAQFHLLGGRPMRDLRILHSSQLDADQKIKVLNTKTTLDTIQPDSLQKESASVDDEQELVYHVDYHGVTTHPDPTPKHPKP